MDKRRIFGENHPNARLKDQDVRAIRREVGHAKLLRKEIKKYSCKAIGRRYGVSATRVREIANGREWTHVPDK